MDATARPRSSWVEAEAWLPHTIGQSEGATAGRKPVSSALREACSRAAHALAAPIAPVIALMTPVALGSSSNPVHKPVQCPFTGCRNGRQLMAGSGGSQGFPAMALLMASSVVMPWATAESR
jgi:hypothetical protein